MHAHVRHETATAAPHEDSQSHVEPERPRHKVRTVSMLQNKQIITYSAVIVACMRTDTPAPFDIRYVVVRALHTTNILNKPRI